MSSKIGAMSTLVKGKEWRSFGGVIQYFTHSSSSTGTEMTFSVLCVHHHLLSLRACSLLRNAYYARTALFLNLTTTHTHSHTHFRHTAHRRKRKKPACPSSTGSLA